MLFFIYRLPRYLLPSFKSIGLSAQEKFKIFFQDDGHGIHLGLPITTILAIFALKVTLILPTTFQVSWHFSSGEEVQKFFKTATMKAILDF